jgi:hypothetical protein
MAGFDPDIFTGGGSGSQGFDADIFTPRRIEAPADAPVAVKAGAATSNALGDIPRQLGLTARYGLEGLANTAQIVTEPLRYLTDRLTGQTGKTVPLGVLATQAADAIGLPKPADANERVIGDATRLVAGAGGLGAAANTARAAPGLAGQAARMLSSNMEQQLASAAGAGLAGGSVREAGGGPVAQGAASLVGGVAAGMAPDALRGAVNAGRSLLNRPTPQQLDQQISVLLQRADVDYSALPNAARSALRNDLQDALRAGRELDPEAVRRLADFRAVGATPTRGMVSQNPVQITREMNLAKIGANTSDEGLQGLALLQNRNNGTLIRNLNDAGANQGDPFRAGQAAIGGIQARDAGMQANVNQLYANVRGMAGGDIPLDRKPFIDNIFSALTQENRLAFLPKEIGDTLNLISSGKAPFTPQTVDMLKTMMATASRSSNDGNVRAALSIARNALEGTPVNLPPLGPGLATGAQAQALRGATTQANDVLGAMNQARQAASQRFAWQESARPIEAALGGAQPDRFVRQFVIGGTLDDARAVAQNGNVQEVKNAIVAHLKEKALNGAADEVGKFSQSAFNKALREIGERKLSLFFSPEEIAQLNAVGRVASYAQVQPVGSAVNNSNSGALLLGKGYDALMNLANKVPVIGPNLVPPIRNIEIAVRNQQAQNVLPGLLAPAERPPMGQGLLLPGVAVGGLLAAP